MNLSLETLCNWCENEMNIRGDGGSKFLIKITSKEEPAPQEDMKAWSYRVDINGQWVFKEVCISESIQEAKEICENRIISAIFTWGINGALSKIKQLV